MAAPFDTVHIPEATKQVVKAFQEFIRWGPCLGLGFWEVPDPSALAVTDVG